jgi:ribonuclease HII
MRAGLSLNYEAHYFRLGFERVVGIDEVGRGALAGPMVLASAVITKFSKCLAGVDDSKRLTFQQRLKLAAELRTNPTITYQLTRVSAKMIDRLGIQRAWYQAINRLISDSNMRTVYLIDGPIKPGRKSKDLQVQTIIHGDSKVYAIAAASIIAKDARDRYMIKMSRKNPEYHWQHNKGYGTIYHRQAIKTFGLNTLHRHTFTTGLLI